ncbi:MAG: response regulator [Planctomycetota bacterium]
MRALLVDDSRALRAIVGRTLKELGFEVTEAAHGKEALERLREHGQPDLALLDWNMPEMSGYELLQAIRREAAWQGLPVMMVTTESETTQVKRALAAGANEYLMKPFTKEALRDKLVSLGLIPSGPT